MSKLLNESLNLSSLYDEEELKLYIQKSLSDFKNEENVYFNIPDSFISLKVSDNVSGYNVIKPEELTNYVLKMKKDTRSFQDQLKEYMRTKNLKDTEIYNPLGMSAKAFNKIKNQKTKASISFDMAVMISFGLHLKVDEMIDMLSLAGKSLKKNDTRHIIVRYFFEKENYDIDALNVALYDYKEKTFLIPKEDNEIDCGIEM